MKTGYFVKAFIPIEFNEGMELHEHFRDALDEVENNKILQPDNIYQVVYVLNDVEQHVFMTIF